MSVRVMSLVWEAHLPPMEKLVLLALADCANDEGICWPSATTLLRKSGQGERTVRRCIKTLTEKGHLTQQKRTGTSSVFRVHPCQPDTPATAAPLSERPVTPATAAPKPLGTVISSEANASSDYVREEKRQAIAACLGKAFPPGGFHPLPVGWFPTRPLSANTQTMVENWPPGAFEAELESFRAWAGNAKPEKGKGLKKDWDDAFGNWIRSAHRDRYSRVVSIQRNRPNLTDLLRASSGDPESGFGIRPALPASGNG